MNKKQLQEDIKDMQEVVNDKDTPADIRASIEPALAKAKQQLKELEEKEGEPKQKVLKKTAPAKAAPAKKQAVVKKMPVKKAASVEKRQPKSTGDDGKLTVENCKKLLAQYKKRKAVANKTADKRKASGKPVHLTAGEALGRVSDQLEDKVQYSVNKSGRLLKSDLIKSQSEVVDIVATLLAGIPDKRERQSFLRELINQLNDLNNQVQPLQRADLGAIIGNPNNPEWQAGGELFEKGGTVKTKVPAHFGSGENFEIFGYKTRNFDICGKAVEKIKHVAAENGINLSGTESSLRDADFKRSVEMLDTMFGIEKSVVAAKEASEGTMKNAANAAMIAQTYLTEAFGLNAGLYDFIGLHLYEISKYIKKKSYKAGGTIESQLFAQGGTIDDIKESKLKSAVELLTAHDDNLMFWKYIGEANYTDKNEAVFLKAFLPSNQSAYVMLVYYPKDGDYSYRLMSGDTTSEFDGIEGFITSYGYETIDEIREELEQDLASLNKRVEKNMAEYDFVEYEAGGIAGAASTEIDSPTGGAGVYQDGGAMPGAGAEDALPDEIGGGDFEKGGMINHGFMKGDRVIEIYKGYGIVENNNDTVIQVVNPDKGTRFIIDLDDSKTTGSRKAIGMTYAEQLHYAKVYIDHISKKETVEDNTFAKGGRLALADIGEQVAEFITDIYPKVRVRTFTYKDNQFVNLINSIGNADANQLGKIYDDKDAAIEYAKKYAEKNSTDGFNVEQKYETGGRIKSAINRDRKYKSGEPHEQKYKRKAAPKNPHYKVVKRKRSVAK